MLSENHGKWKSFIINKTTIVFNCQQISETLIKNCKNCITISLKDAIHDSANNFAFTCCYELKIALNETIFKLFPCFSQRF